MWLLGGGSGISFSTLPSFHPGKPEAPSPIRNFDQLISFVMSSVSEATILASSVSWPSGTATKTTSSARRASASASRVTDHYGTPPAGALTTIWTPPCGIVTGTYTKASETCMPPGWNIYWASNAGYYSPAICPSGFIPGCTRTLRQGPVVVAGETAVNCVPS